MIEALDVFRNWLISNLEKYPLLISLIGPFIGGEIVFMSLCFLSGMKLFPIWILFISGTIQAFAYDSFWFFTSKKSVLPVFLKRINKKTNHKLKKIEKKDLPLFLFMMKFLIGTKTASLISIGLNHIQTKRFLVYSFITSFLWASVIITIGWLAGKGYTGLISIFKNTQYALIILILLAIMIYSIRNHIHHEFNHHIHKNILKPKK